MNSNNYSSNYVCLVILSVFISLLIGCVVITHQKSADFALQDGDLLFQDVDCGPLCDAIEKVTTGFNGANFSHVGIVTKSDNGWIVIEAVSAGVQIAPLQDFLERSLDVENRPKVAVGRLKPAFRHLIPAALSEAFALKGMPYDKPFVIGNDAYYCSELIYEIFAKANNDKPLFKLQPMTFNDPDTKSTFPVWQEYFSRLGIPVPEGEPGINPGAISRSDVIDIIHLYGNPDGWKESGITSRKDGSDVEGFSVEKQELPSFPAKCCY